MRFEEVLPALREGKAIQRTGRRVSWAYLVRSPNGAFHWYGFGDDPTRASPMTIDHEDLDAADWAIVDPAEALARKPAATHNCQRRREQGRMPVAADQVLDYWSGPEHARTCSYCGSLHPGDFLTFVRQGAEVVPTDKDYKAYLRTDLVPYGKFYFQHLDEAQAQEFVSMINAKTVQFGFPGYFYTKPFFITYEESKT